MSDDQPSPTTAEHTTVQEDIPSERGGSEVESGTVAHDPIISSVDVDDDDDDDDGDDDDDDDGDDDDDDGVFQ